MQSSVLGPAAHYTRGGLYVVSKNRLSPHLPVTWGACVGHFTRFPLSRHSGERFSVNHLPDGGRDSAVTLCMPVCSRLHGIETLNPWFPVHMHQHTLSWTCRRKDWNRGQCVSFLVICDWCTMHLRNSHVPLESRDTGYGTHFDTVESPPQNRDVPIARCRNSQRKFGLQRSIRPVIAALYEAFHVPMSTVMCFGYGIRDVISGEKLMTTVVQRTFW